MQRQEGGERDGVSEEVGARWVAAVLVGGSRGGGCGVLRICTWLWGSVFQNEACTPFEDGEVSLVGQGQYFKK